MDVLSPVVDARRVCVCTSRPRRSQIRSTASLVPGMCHRSCSGAPEAAGCGKNSSTVEDGAGGSPIAIDARMKAWYPKELSSDPATAALVSRRWKEYFPAGRVEMGDAEAAHLD